MRRGGAIGISFWGNGTPLDLRRCLLALARNAPASHLEGMRRTNTIARPRVAETMLESAGFEIAERGADRDPMVSHFTRRTGSPSR